MPSFVYIPLQKTLENELKVYDEAVSCSSTWDKSPLLTDIHQTSKRLIRFPFFECLQVNAKVCKTNAHTILVCAKVFIVKKRPCQCRQIITPDPLLSDLPENATLEEVNTLIAIEEGRAYRVRIKRNGLEDVPLVVSQATSVKQIKYLTETTLKRMLRKQGIKRSINWKYIWRTHCLVLNGEKLLNDKAVVSSLGIKNDTVLSFERHIERKTKAKASKRRL
ncbi:unnamed protein product [Umbelopsis ramanniana]